MSDAVRRATMPAEVRQVIGYGTFAGLVQLLVAAVAGPGLARAASPMLGVAAAAVLVLAAIATFTTVVALSRGSERARRLLLWPEGSGLHELGISGFVRQRLRSRAAEQWFRARAAARRTGGPQ